jgi:tetratricopeptide (TPR) repeat protein
MPVPCHLLSPRRCLDRRLLVAAAALLLGACGDVSMQEWVIADGSGRALTSSRALDPDGGDSAAGNYLAGRFALNQGDLRAAADSFERALSADPSNFDLRREIFLLNLASGEIDQALAGADDLAALDPDTDEVDLVLALRDAKAGRFHAARQSLGRISARGLTGLAVPLLEAWTRYGAGDLEEALRRLRADRGEEAMGSLRRYHEALILSLSGRAVEGRDLLRRIVEPEQAAPVRIVQALAALEVETGDRAAALELLRGQVQRAGGEGALGEILDAYERGEPPPLPVRDATSGMADALLGVAEALSQQRAGAQALLFARLAAYLAPDRGDVWMVIGRVEQSQGNSAEAIRAYSAVSAASPWSWSARLARAEAMAAAEREGEAAALLRQMAAERPARTDALRDLGDLHRRAERYAEAGQAYAEAIGRLRTVEPEDWRLFYAHGIALERLKRWPEAEASLSRALELSPDQPLVLNYLGYSWVDQGQNLDRAKEMLHRAVELRSQDGFIVDSLGWAYFRLGEFAEAVTQLERAVELEPGDPVINDHLGDAYWRVGRHREARFQWQRALTLKPETDTIAEIEGKLERGLPAISTARRG